jgi:hypothetical protein
MRFHFGAVPEATGFTPDDTWKPLHEPSPWIMQLVALPLGVVMCVSIGALWLWLTPLREYPLDSLGVVLGIFAATVPIHELIHATVHPNVGRSNASVLGFWPSRMLFYAHYTGELSRARLIAILLMPLLIISIVPLAACAVIGRSSGWLAIGSTLNALCACGDVFAVGVLLFQVPADAKVRNQGWRTYWRK